MSPEEIAWVAGILEGEGTFSGNRHRVTCAMTDRDIIARLAQTTGVGRIYFSKRQKEHHKDVWIWSVIRRSEVTELTRAIIPWLGERRTAAAILLCAGLLLRSCPGPVRGLTLSRGGDGI